MYIFIYIYMGPGILEIDLTFVLFCTPPPEGQNSLRQAWGFYFGPGPAPCGSARACAGRWRLKAAAWPAARKAKCRGARSKALRLVRTEKYCVKTEGFIYIAVGGDTPAQCSTQKTSTLRGELTLFKTKSDRV